MNYVRKHNELFQGDYHQDSHEFLFWILDKMNDILLQENKTKCIINYSTLEREKGMKTWL